MAATLTLTVRDETADGRPAHEWRLDVPVGRLSVRDLIRDRVRREADDYNACRPHTYRGLVQPPAEVRRRGDDSSHVCKPIDWARQCDLACEAFAARRLLILIGDVQADSLDEDFEVRPGTAVTFLRLTTLVGG